MPGVYVQENNGEPGTIQSMLVRGLSSPVFSNKDVSGVQPTVYLNGVPLMLENSYVYDIKQFDINPIGAAANMLAGLDISFHRVNRNYQRSASACQIRSFSC